MSYNDFNFLQMSSLFEFNPNMQELFYFIFSLTREKKFNSHQSMMMYSNIKKLQLLSYGNKNFLL